MGGQSSTSNNAIGAALSNPTVPYVPPAVPTPKNSSKELDDAAARQRRARGAAATIFRGAGGSGSLLSDWGNTTQRMLLGS